MQLRFFIQFFFFFVQYSGSWVLLFPFFVHRWRFSFSSLKSHIILLSVSKCHYPATIQYDKYSRLHEKWKRNIRIWKETWLIHKFFFFLFVFLSFFFFSYCVIVVNLIWTKWLNVISKYICANNHNHIIFNSEKNLRLTFFLFRFIFSMSALALFCVRLKYSIVPHSLQ